MAKGKYAARAANRLAEIDSGIVAELRDKLAVATAERDAAQAEARQLRSHIASEARALAETMSESAVNELAAELIEARKDREDDRREHFRAVLDWMGQAGVQAPWGRMAELGELFGLSNREAAEIFRVPNGRRSRDDRRASMTDLRQIGEIKRRQAGKDPKLRLEYLQKGLPL